MAIANRCRLWPVVTSALVGLPVLYVASFGPVCWLINRQNTTARYVAKVYWPLGRIATYSDHPVNRPLRWYAGLFAEKWRGSRRTDLIFVPVGWGSGLVGNESWDTTSWKGTNDPASR
jgi:hypothetical protein